MTRFWFLSAAPTIACSSGPTSMGDGSQSILWVRPGLHCSGHSVVLINFSCKYHVLNTIPCCKLQPHSTVRISTSARGGRVPARALQSTQPKSERWARRKQQDGTFKLLFQNKQRKQRERDAWTTVGEVFSTPRPPPRLRPQRTRHRPPRSPSRGQPCPHEPQRTHPPPCPHQRTSEQRHAWST